MLDAEIEFKLCESCEKERKSKIKFLKRLFCDLIRLDFTGAGRLSSSELCEECKSDYNRHISKWLDDIFMEMDKNL